MADGGRDRADAVRLLFTHRTYVGMGHRRASQIRGRPESLRHLQAHGRWCDSGVRRLSGRVAGHRSRACRPLCPFLLCGRPRRQWRTGSAFPASAERQSLSRRMRAPSAPSHGAPGAFSKRLSRPRIICCRRIIFRKIRIRSWLIAPRQRTSACTLLAVLAAHDLGWIGTCERGRAARIHGRHDAQARAVSRTFLQLVRPRTISVLSIQNTFPRSIAEILPAI